ncbi:MAG: LLM class flavin-dependent oxidoreductase, partial [Promethearchaeota archaeon]
AVAKHADKSNFGFIPIELFKHKLSVLKEHCKAIGREYDSIEKTNEVGVIIHRDRDEYLVDMKRRFEVNVGVGSFKDWLKSAEEAFIAGTPDECVNQLQEFVDVGVSHFMIRFGDLPSFDGMRLFVKEVAPKLKL